MYFSLKHFLYQKCELKVLQNHVTNQRSDYTIAIYLLNQLFMKVIREFVYNKSMYKIPILLLLLLLTISAFKTPQSDLNAALEHIRQNRSLMGIQLEITNKTHVIYHGNFGLKDNVKPIQNQTMFRAASLSKSVAAAGVMLLVEQGKIKLNQTLSSILGFEVKNPNFPDVDITVQMTLSHQSSLIECEPYYSNFLTASYVAKTGYEVPPIKEILVEGGKFYNKCLFGNMQPGTHYQYVNLNFGIAGAIIQKVSGIRFDLFVRERILRHISEGLAEIATFNIATIQNSEHLGTCFEEEDGKWVPAVDYYPDGKIPERNLTGYVIGSSGVIFGPQGGMRASASHLSNYITMLANKGVTKQGTRILSAASVEQMLKPRYQFHGNIFGDEMSSHNYGFGIYTTSYRSTDSVIPHEIVRGHTGDAYGLKSAYYFWGNYTLTYIINGALYGYEEKTGTIYERQRLLICEAVTNFINSLN